MPRLKKPPRLWLHPKEKVWIILDGGKWFRTGLAKRDREQADLALQEYQIEKYKPQPAAGDLSKISVAEVLAAYGSEHAPKLASAANIGYCIRTLAPFWAERKLSDVRQRICEQYTDERRKTGVSDYAVRSELAILSASIGFYHKAYGPLPAVPIVSMPKKPTSRLRWLTRPEAALLLAAALGFWRTTWCDVKTRRVHAKWHRSQQAINRPLARFILTGLASGSRSNVIYPLRWMPHLQGGYIDVKAGVIHRKSGSHVETNKRRPPAKLSRRFIAHCCKWQKNDPHGVYVIGSGQAPIGSLKKSFARAAEFSMLEGRVTPHVLRHTRATWLMLAGVDKWQASGQLGMSIKMLEEVYGHHHPSWQQDASEV